MEVRRGEVYTTNLIEKTTTGTEVGKKRPAVVVQADTWNEDIQSTIVLPLSSVSPTYRGLDIVVLKKGEANLDKDSIVLFPQIRSVDKSRLEKKVGSISEGKLKEIDQVLSLVLGLRPID